MLGCWGGDIADGIKDGYTTLEPMGSIEAEGCFYLKSTLYTHTMTRCLCYLLLLRHSCEYAIVVLAGLLKDLTVCD